MPLRKVRRRLVTVRIAARAEIVAVAEVVAEDVVAGGPAEVVAADTMDAVVAGTVARDTRIGRCSGEKAVASPIRPGRKSRPFSIRRCRQAPGRGSHDLDRPMTDKLKSLSFKSRARVRVSRLQ